MTFTFNGEVITIIGRSHFLVESRTCPGEHHVIDLEERVCSCKGFTCRGRCRHLASTTLIATWLTGLKSQTPALSANAPDAIA